MILPSGREAALLGMALGKPIARRDAGHQARPPDSARGRDAGPTARQDPVPGVCQAIQQARPKGILPRPDGGQVPVLPPTEGRFPRPASPDFPS